LTNTKDIIIRLKEVRKERNLSYGDILELMEQNGDFVAKSTLSKLFADGSEDHPEKFRYENTLRPIANAILDMETIEDDDDMDIQALKAILKYKIERIKELETMLDHEKIKHHEKLDKERDQFQRSLTFCREQISLKDKRIDQLMDANMDLTRHFLNCPYKQGCKDET
jgi:transcriptional regulator with XRE-family HTH domain